MTEDELEALPVGAVISGTWREGDPFAAIKQKPSPWWPDRWPWEVTGDDQRYGSHELAELGQGARVLAG